MPTLPKILFVDDEQDLRDIAIEYFGTQYEVLTAENAEAARKTFQLSPPNVAILDVRMPGEDGLSLARWIREQYPQTGIVMLTTAAEVVDRIIGLELGADDYIAKPFDLRELSARVKSVLRRVIDRGDANRQQLQAKPHRTRLGLCELDLKEHRLYGRDGVEIGLTSMEFDLLKVFAEHPNKVMNRDQIMALACHRDWDVYDRSIDLRVMRLRRKIETDPDKPEVLKTVRGAGYMLLQP
ncbi:response regulator [Methylovulum psychrotolerans]|jgi:two-component system phosphate regulon response regulator OmpR|uniref:response regulator n=1 Tax=Methylovulum psychrotolerans TaxID=1704499 RepID=UPI001BFFA58C|nr:response regulator [Methylovulum psychrotolerans]MBT9098133.1 response regulator [Methylovulum psychrotolerans]